MSTAMIVADCLFFPDTRFSEREVNLTPRSTDCEWQGKGVLNGVSKKCRSLSSGILDVRDGSVILICPPLSSINVKRKSLSSIMIISCMIFASKFNRGFLKTLKTDVLDDSRIRSIH